MITPKQKEWLHFKNIKEGGIYSFPSMGFSMYASPSYSSGGYVDTNPLTKSLAHTSFKVKSVDGDFARVNYTDKPYKYDFYLSISEIERRDFIEMGFLYLILYIPFNIYNYLKQTKYERK